MEDHKLREDISDISDEIEEAYGFTQTEKECVESSGFQRIAYQWVDLARQSLRLKYLVSDIVDKYKKSKCHQCKSDFSLHVLQKHNFYVLFNGFLEETAGRAFSRDVWRKYFERKQIFETYCMECAFKKNLEEIKALNMGGGGEAKERKDIYTALTNKATDNQYKLELKANIQRPHVVSILYIWLFKARSQLLHQQVDKIEKEGQTYEFKEIHKRKERRESVAVFQGAFRRHAGIYTQATKAATALDADRYIEEEVIGEAYETSSSSSAQSELDQSDDDEDDDDNEDEDEDYTSYDSATIHDDDQHSIHSPHSSSQ